MTYKVPRRALDGPTLPAPAGPPREAASPGTVAPPEEHRGGFYALSVELTGFGEVELLGTGVGDLYLAWLLRVFPDVMPDLLDAWRAVEDEYPPEERDQGLRRAILDDARLGPFARAVLHLWYTTTWTPPANWAPPGSTDWPKDERGQPLDPDHREDQARSFGAAYPEGLMWRAAIGAHPEGAKPTGFGTWASPPREV